ncbi:uncharacterized protein [Typha latifolia]|uniref:uncharacterized protein n=1 Tax=Typha latifolia TaxID=4733 RepID=UPI003C2F499D
MIKEFLQRKVDFDLRSQGKEIRKAKYMSVMDQPELSLGPAFALNSANCSSQSELDNNSSKKRKHTWDEPITQYSIELHLNDPLPLDWEQCLDLQSGRMYYLNRKTLKKSWTRPKEKNLNLDLNISTFPSSQGNIGSSTTPEELSKKQHNTSSGAMVAVVCANCHLLVVISKSSPSCPNCRYMNSSPPTTALRTPSMEIDAVKPLETLSLLH